MKVKKSHRGGVLLSLILVLSMILTPCAAFADTANVALMLTVEAAPLDFTVTDSLSMHATQGQTALTIDSLAVTNTGSEDLKVSSITITPAAGWSVEASSTDFGAAGKTALGFTCNGHDFSGGAYAPGETLAAGSNLSYTLAGQISANADLMSATQVASMVLTLERAVTITSFTIAGTSYQAEEGMTWEEWCNSSYNIDSEFSVSGLMCIQKTSELGPGSLRVKTSSGIEVDPSDNIIADESYIMGSGGSN